MADPDLRLDCWISTAYTGGAVGMVPEDVLKRFRALSRENRSLLIEAVGKLYDGLKGDIDG